MAPAAGVSEALTPALCRVALASALCQAACVVNRRLGSCRGARRLQVKAKAPPFGSSQCLAVYLVSVHQPFQFAFLFLTQSLADLE